MGLQGDEHVDHFAETSQYGPTQAAMLQGCITSTTAVLFAHSSGPGWTTPSTMQYTSLHWLPRPHGREQADHGPGTSLAFGGTIGMREGVTGDCDVVGDVDTDRVGVNDAVSECVGVRLRVCDLDAVSDRENDLEAVALLDAPTL